MELCAQALLLYGLEFDQAPLKIPGSIRPPEAARIIADYQPLFKLLPPTASWVYDAYTVIINDQYICDAAYANVFKSPLGFVVPIGWGVGSNSTGLQPPGVLQKISVRQRYDWDIKVSVMFPGSDVLAPVNYSVRVSRAPRPFLLQSAPVISLRRTAMTVPCGRTLACVHHGHDLLGPPSLCYWPRTMLRSCRGISPGIPLRSTFSTSSSGTAALFC